MPPKAKEASAAQIRKFRDQDPQPSWNSVAEHFGITPAQAMLDYEKADGANAIKGSDAQVGKAIVKARKEGLSWGIIMGRSGLGLQKVRSIYAEYSGEDPSASNIGKGGRTPGSGGGGVKKKAVKKATKKAPVKKAAKKAPAKKAVAKKATKRAPAKKAAKKASSESA